jgi:hypothetical protein
VRRARKACRRLLLHSIAGGIVALPLRHDAKSVAGCLDSFWLRYYSTVF